MSVAQALAQCATGGAVWLNGANNGMMQDTGLLGGYVTVRATTVGSTTSGRPLYQVAGSSWKGLTYAALQVWRAYSSPASNYTSFKLDHPLDSTYFHVRVDNIRGDMFNWESQNVRGYLNGVEVPADFKDPVNGATVSGNTINGSSSTNSTTQSAMRVFFTGPVDSIVVRQTSWSDWVIIELMMQCNILLPASLERWSAIKNGSYAEIQWANSLEAGLKAYELERSTDGKKFSSITSFPPGPKRYAYKDPLGNDGKVYYRLKMITSDGRFVYSSVLLVRGNITGNFSISPNPVMANFEVQLPKGPSYIQVISMEGRDVFRKYAAGKISIDASTWPAGQYVIIVNNDSQITTEKLIKLK